MSSFCFHWASPGRGECKLLRDVGPVIANQDAYRQTGTGPLRMALEARSADMRGQCRRCRCRVSDAGAELVAARWLTPSPRFGNGCPNRGRCRTTDGIAKSSGWCRSRARVPAVTATGDAGVAATLRIQKYEELTISRRGGRYPARSRTGAALIRSARRRPASSLAMHTRSSWAPTGFWSCGLPAASRRVWVCGVNTPPVKKITRLA